MKKEIKNLTLRERVEKAIKNTWEGDVTPYVIDHVIKCMPIIDLSDNEGEFNYTDKHSNLVSELAYQLLDGGLRFDELSQDVLEDYYHVSSTIYDEWDDYELEECFDGDEMDYIEYLKSSYLESLDESDFDWLAYGEWQNSDYTIDEETEIAIGYGV